MNVRILEALFADRANFAIVEFEQPSAVPPRHADGPGRLRSDVH